MLINGEEERIFARHVDDCISAAIAGRVRFTKFLTPPLALLAKNRAARDSRVCVSFFGGCDGAERTVAAFSPAGVEIKPADFPICCALITNKSGFELSHRDYLGALMSLSLEREVLGDIVGNENGCSVFLLERFGVIVRDELVTVGRAGVSVELAKPADIFTANRRRESVTVNVSSMRLDCIIAAVLNKNRALAKELVLKAAVNLNYAPCDDPSVGLKTGDILSVRGFGKFEVGAPGGKSKKDRLFLEMIKY